MYAVVYIIFQTHCIISVVVCLDQGMCDSRAVLEAIVSTAACTLLCHDSTTDVCQSCFDTVTTLHSLCFVFCSFGFCRSQVAASFVAVYKLRVISLISLAWQSVARIIIYICKAVCVSVCLLITRKRVGQLPLNCQGSSRAYRDSFGHKKLGVMGKGPENLHFFGWLGGRVVSVPDSGSEEHGFESQSQRCRVSLGPTVRTQCA